MTTAANLGTIELQRSGPRVSKWLIKCRPDVEARLRRMFQGCTSANGSIRISNTPDTCRDLSWCLLRYPLEGSEADLAYLQQQASDHVATIERFGAIAAGTYTTREFNLALDLHPYQEVGAEAAIQGKRLLIADEMGLGKTAQAIALMVQSSARPALVVTLTTLPAQWAREIKKFAPGMQVHVLKGCKPYDLSEHGTLGRSTTPLEQQALPGVNVRTYPDVIVTSYSKIAAWGPWIAKDGVVKTLVLDEIQELCNPQTDKYQGAFAVSNMVEYCLGLSGTPIRNRGGEWHPIFDLLKPGCLGTLDEYIRGWCHPEGRGYSVTDPKAFGAFLREQGLMLRRDRDDVGLQLPKAQRFFQPVDADMEVLNKIGKDAAELAKAILARTGTWAERGKMAERFDMLLRQSTGIAKAPAVAQFVRMLIESGEPVLLFGWHRSCHDIWRDQLKNFNPVFITGSESPAAKQRAFDAFTQGRTKLCIVSLRSGAGIDGFQHVCRTLVVGELDWVPQVHDQIVTRVDRAGQKSPVFAYFMVSDKGADPTMLDVLTAKKAQSRGVLDPEAPLVETKPDPDHILKLARNYLAQRGEKLPAEPKDGDQKEDHAAA